MRPPGMRWGKCRIVAPDLGVVPARVREEEQVVNRHHLGGVTCRKEKRVRGVSDVKSPGNGLNWWPFGTMPERVQELVGDSPVDHRCAQLFRQPACRPILP